MQQPIEDAWSKEPVAPASVHRVPTAPAPVQLRRLETLADLFDRKYVDPILGLVFPGVGDALGAVFGLYTVYVAWRCRLHPATIARMLTMLSLDALLGSIPVVGAVFDFFYRPQIRNVELLKRRLSSSEWTKPRAVGSAADATYPRARTTLPAKGSDYFVLGSALAFFAVALIVPLVVAIALIGWLISLV